MSEGTKIQWCDDTHNFWQGCTKVSPGCANCYAEARDQRFSGGAHWGKGAPRVRSKDFEAPLRWNEKPEVCDRCGVARALEHAFAETVLGPCDKCGKGATFHRRRVFSLSLGDWLDEEIPIEWLADMLDVIRQCPNLDFLLLTKRPENWFHRLQAARDWAVEKFTEADTPLKSDDDNDHLWCWLEGWLCARFDSCKFEIPANVWIGVTIENQEYADKRIPELLKIPAVCRFVSYEPALGPVDFGFKGEESLECSECNWQGTEDDAKQDGDESDTWYLCPSCGAECAHTPMGEYTRGIDWIIVGGESGSKARPFNIECARSTKAQCQASGIACFVKQIGAHPCEELVYTPSDSMVPEIATQWKSFKDKKGGDMAEWPSDLRVREFPTP